MAWEQQSPINLRATFAARAPRDFLKLAWSEAVQGFRHVGDHGVEVLFGFSPDSYLDLDGKRFHLKQFHFHHPSEHLLDGLTFDGEVHLVHQNLDDLSLAVVGIFLSVDSATSSSDESAHLIDMFRLANESRSAIPLTPVWWLPEKHDRVMRYEGSLTTEPFTESVSWIVFREHRPISPELFNAIFECHPQKARAIQARNRRFVIDLSIKPIMADRSGV
jgi:carbonic anhydrase